MELITTYRFKWNGQFIGILGKKDPIIRTTLFPQHAIHHTDEDYYWVCEKLTRHGFDYTVEKFTHLYSPLKNHRHDTNTTHLDLS
jgi:hypothetical protein